MLYRISWTARTRWIWLSVQRPPAIWGGLDGAFSGKLPATFALANAAQGAICALVQAGPLRMIADGLTVDDGDCIQALLDGFARVLEIECVEGNLADCCEAFRAIGGTERLEELQEQGDREIQQRLGILWAWHEAATIPKNENSGFMAGSQAG
jgi:hypothetical protein